MSTFIELSQSIALILSLTFIYGFIDPRLERIPQRAEQVLKGLVFGSFAVISMMMPIQVTQGLFYDARTVVICIAGTYSGAIPAFIAAAMVGVYRISLGGVGTVGAVAGAFAAALIGTAMHLYYQQRSSKPGAAVLLVTGVALAVVGGVFALLGGIEFGVVSARLPTTITLYPVGMLLLGALVSEQRNRREIERTLSVNEQRFRAIFNSASQFVGLLTPDGRLIEANENALNFAGIRAADVLEQPLWDTYWWTLSSDTQATLRAAIQRATSGEVVQYEVDIQGADEQRMTMDFTLKPLLDGAGRVALLIAVGHDISPLKELERQKVDLALERERSRLLKKFISDVSHDLRTPLAVIRLNLELLRRTLDSPQHQQRVEILASQEQHLTRLLTDMMTMLTLDEQSNFQFKPLNLNEVAQLVIDAHHGALQNKQQMLTFNHPEDALLVRGDQVELERALSKLFINAINYTPKGGGITVSVLQEDDRAVIELRDTGIGISPDDLPNIFQRFFRADRARSLDTGGTGLGLPIAKRIVEAHGGQIEVESALDAGSSFRVILPFHSESQTAAADPQHH